MLDQFPVRLSLRIDWSEMDLFGHVNNVAFFKYLQASRVNYWETIGLSAYFNQTHIGPILASSTCNFKKALHYPGNITVLVKVEFMKNTSFGLSHIILNDKNEIAAEGNDVIVMYDFNLSEKVAIPTWLRDKMETLEGKKF